MSTKKANTTPGQQASKPSWRDDWNGYLYRAPGHDPSMDIESNTFIHAGPVPGQQVNANQVNDPELVALARKMGVTPQDLIRFEQLMRQMHGGQGQQDDDLDSDYQDFIPPRPGVDENDQ
jgi:hypothetical protein